MDQPPGNFPPPPPSFRPPPPTNFPPPPEHSPAPGGAPAGAGGMFPMDLGRIFQLTFSIFRFGWSKLLAAALIISLPFAIAIAVMSASFVNSTMDWYALGQRIARGQPIELTESVLVGIGLSLLLGIVVAVSGYLGQAAAIHIARRIYHGNAAGAVAGVRFSISRVVTLAAVYLVTFAVAMAIVAAGTGIATAVTAVGGGGLADFLALVLFVAGFAAVIFVTIRWSLVVPVIVFERVGAMDALRRSWRLVDGSGWRVLGYMIVFSLTFGLAAYVLTLVVTLIVSPTSIDFQTLTISIDPVRLGIAQLLTAVINALVAPFTAIAAMLLYLDLRWRNGEPLTAAAGN